MRGWMDAATLTRTLNLQGRFLAYGAEGLPFLLQEGTECALVPPVEDAPRTVTVASAEPAHGKHEGGFCITFAEVDGGSVAEALVGCHCLVRERDAERMIRSCADGAASGHTSMAGLVHVRASLVEAEGEATALDERRWTVVDERAGRIGTLARIEERPAQSLLVVAREAPAEDGGAAEVLIPFVDELVESIDEGARIISVRVPAGLLDL